MKHKNWPYEGILFWDFYDPEILNTLKDVSAATVVASALVEVTSFANKNLYLDYAKHVLKTLMSNEHILSATIKTTFILNIVRTIDQKKMGWMYQLFMQTFNYLELLLRLKK